MRRTNWPALAVIAAIAVAGCGSDANTSSGPSVTFAPVPTTAATVTPTTAGATTSPTSGAGASSGTAGTSDTLAGTLDTTTGPATTGDAATTAVPTTNATNATNAPATPVTAAATAAGPPTTSIVELAKVAAPVGIAVRPGDPRLFVISQGGTVTPVGTDGTVGAPVLDVSKLTTADGERGLLGLAFHPTEPLAYIDYTASDTGDTHIDEFAVAADGTFDPASRREVLEIDQPYANHNGGQLAFGPDGDLYIGMGDGGAGGDPQRRALNAGELLGKILRIDPRQSGGEPYTSPADNPYVGVAGARPEIWSVGVRNPFRFSFDAATGDLWIADVGQDKWEEIDVAWAADGGGRGENFGWSAFEGNHRYNEDQSTNGAVGPIHEYAHGDDGCSISGGARYRGAAIPSLQGWYVYGDYCSGQVRALQINDRTSGTEVVLGTPGGVSSVAAGADGELYVTSVGNGAVYRIAGA